MKYCRSEFLQIVENLPMLWNPLNPYFFDIEKKEQKWKDVGLIFNMRGGEMEERFEKLIQIYQTNEDPELMELLSFIKSKKLNKKLPCNICPFNKNLRTDCNSDHLKETKILIYRSIEEYKNKVYSCNAQKCNLKKLEKIQKACSLAAEIEQIYQPVGAELPIKQLNIRIEKEINQFSKEPFNPTPHIPLIPSTMTSVSSSNLTNLIQHRPIEIKTKLLPQNLVIRPILQPNFINNNSINTIEKTTSIHPVQQQPIKIQIRSVPQTKPVQTTSSNHIYRMPSTTKLSIRPIIQPTVLQPATQSSVQPIFLPSNLQIRKITPDGQPVPHLQFIRSPAPKSIQITPTTVGSQPFVYQQKPYPIQLHTINNNINIVPQVQRIQQITPTYYNDQTHIHQIKPKIVKNRKQLQQIGSTIAKKLKASSEIKEEKVIVDLNPNRFTNNKNSNNPDEIISVIKKENSETAFDTVFTITHLD